VTPREQWARIGLGGKRIADASNIIFSNGAYDPWSPGGVHTKLNPSIHPILIPSGAHHIDLMFSDPADPPDVTNVRQTELKIIKGWLGDSE
jgi:lysosomal Pro-X carboxypeptidase